MQSYGIKCQRNPLQELKGVGSGREEVYREVYQDLLFSPNFIRLFVKLGAYHFGTKQ